MLESFATATANRSTILPLRSRVSPACGVHTLFAVNLCGRGQFAIDLLAHLGFKRMVSCCFRDKRMRLKTRAYGTYISKDTISINIRIIFSNTFIDYRNLCPDFPGALCVCVRERRERERERERE